MNTKAILSVAAGSLFTGIVLAIIFYVAERHNNSSTMLGPAKDWAWLGLVFGAIVGGIVGGVCAAVVVQFRLDSLQGVLFGLFVGLALCVIFYLYTGGGIGSSHIIASLTSSAVIVINCLLVVFVNNGIHSSGPR